MTRSVIIAVLTLAALASLGLWAASCFTYQLAVIPYVVGDGSIGCTVSRGTLGFVRTWSFGESVRLEESRLRISGLFEVYRGSFGDIGLWSLDVRLWLLFVLLAAYPAIVLVRGAASRYRRPPQRVGALRLPRTRGVLRWAATGACILILLVWFGSGYCGIAYRGPASWAAFVDGGLLSVFWTTPARGPTGPAARAVHAYAIRQMSAPPVRGRLLAFWGEDRDKRWVVTRGHPRRFSLGARWRFIQGRPSPLGSATRGIVCPLWILFVLAAVPAALMWWSAVRRRYPVGCCRNCGYDLTGNVSGRCPECGAGITGEATSVSERELEEQKRRRQARIAVNSLAVLAVLAIGSCWIHEACLGPLAAVKTVTQPDTAGDAPPIENVVAKLISSDWPTVREAKLALEARPEEAVPPLIELLGSDERVEFANAGDLSRPGGRPSRGRGHWIGHGYDIGRLDGRAGWVLEEITFENFGFSERAVRKHRRLTAATQAEIYREAAERARAWWRHLSPTWSRFSALLSALRSEDTLRQARALEWLRYGGTRCEGLNKCTYDKLIRPLAEKLAGSTDREVRQQARDLLDGIGWRWFCDRCGYDLIGVDSDRCPNCGGTVEDKW